MAYRQLWSGALLLSAAIPGAVCRAAPPPRLEAGRLTSAETCGRCHRDILEAWKSSVHARSMEDRVFQDCLEEARSEFGDEVQARCLGCHAPTVAYTGDGSLESKVSWEGVTCDFCHSVAQVDLRAEERPFQLQIGAAKFGPLRDASSPGHGVAYSRLHADAVLCAGCHEARNARGLAALSSYSEWRESSYAADRASCVTCHMAPVKARVVDPKVARVKNAVVNLHQMPGGHSVDQLNKALGARVSTRRSGGQLEVAVAVRNRGAGHMVPTGSPLRRLILAVEVHTADGGHLQDERVYQRVIVDEAGNALRDEHSVWMRGARVVSDNRLRPGEERTETFRFAVAPSVAARIQARFWYFYSPMADQKTGRVAFLTVPALAPAQ